MGVLRMNVKTYEIIKDIYWVGVVDYDLRVFDIIMETEFGSTYNAYLVRGSDKTALIDTAKAKFSEEYIAKVKELVDINKIDYLVVNHTEPDHSGSIINLIRENPNIQIYASGPAIVNLKEIINDDFNATRVKEGMEISLGNKTIRFHIQPNLHWPDTIFSHVIEDNFLFTCDFFGSHYAFDDVMYDNVENKENYKRALKEYYDAIMSPFTKAVHSGIKRVEEINPDYIGVSHGAVLDKKIIPEFVQAYKTWSKIKEKMEKPLVVIPYVSAYGYTEKMANAIKKGIEQELKGEVYVEIYDMVFADMQKVISRIEIADAFMIGSSTILRDTVKIIWDLLAMLNYEMLSGKTATAFGSYGWSGEAVPNIIERLNQLRVKTVEGKRIKFNPSEDQIQEMIDFGIEFAKNL